jgi:hypothetical protein
MSIKIRFQVILFKVVQIIFMKYLKQFKISSIRKHLIWKKGFNQYQKYFVESNILSFKYLHVFCTVTLICYLFLACVCCPIIIQKNWMSRSPKVISWGAKALSKILPTKRGIRHLNTGDVLQESEIGNRWESLLCLSVPQGKKKKASSIWRFKSFWMLRNVACKTLLDVSPERSAFIQDLKKYMNLQREPNPASASVLRNFSLCLCCKFASLPNKNAAFHLICMNCPKFWRPIRSTLT